MTLTVRGGMVAVAVDSVVAGSFPSSSSSSSMSLVCRKSGRSVRRKSGGRRRCGTRERGTGQEQQPSGVLVVAPPAPAPPATPPAVDQVVASLGKSYMGRIGR
ncbi:hypothetical protein ZHAS_00006485 [Anopheles sinensis]|uniref:Uncharacterized protein n=1 Tax=Anopheles sinensis TaxID=74873 RepID=A0A084VMF7_ANOSI|nr:hypothetical protein ZHAS_00006485 [Anopheles sinensis]